MTYWKYLHSNLTSYNKKCEIPNYEASGVLNLRNYSLRGKSPNSFIFAMGPEYLNLINVFFHSFELNNKSLLCFIYPMT